MMFQVDEIRMMITKKVVGGGKFPRVHFKRANSQGQLIEKLVGTANSHSMKPTSGCVVHLSFCEN